MGINPKKKSNLKQADLPALKDPFRPNKPGPKGIWEIKSKDQINTQWICRLCGTQLPSQKGGAWDPSCKCKCGKVCVDVAVIAPPKNEPDKPGKRPFLPPMGVHPNQRLSTGLIFDSKSHKFIISKKIKLPRLKDEHESEEFKQILHKPRFRKHKPEVELTDEGCSVDPDEAERACNSLCIDG